MRISCAGNTDVGVVRSGNEDSFLLDCAKGLFIVADGMGGHRAGEQASALAVETIETFARRVVNAAGDFPRVAGDEERRLAMRMAL